MSGWVTAVLVAVISAALGSLVTLWTKWGIEKRRHIRSVRAELIADCRALLVDPPQSSEFRIHPLYSRIRPFLSAATKRAVEGQYEQGREVIQIVAGGRGSGINPYAHLVLDELSRIEAEWELI